MSDLVSGLISIVTPAYNSARFIGEAIVSAQNQTYANWEMLVVVDKGTTDNTIEIVEEFQKKDARIKLIHIKDQKGLALSRNRAMAEAKGQYLTFLDSDDLWLQTKLEDQVQFMQTQKADFSCTAFRRIDEANLNLGRLLEVPPKIDYHTLLKQNVIGCLTAMVDISKTGPLQMQEIKHEDFLLWLELLKRGHLCFGLNKDLARYRVVGGSRSANKAEMLNYRWKILRDFENLGLLTSCYYVAVYTVKSLFKYSAF